MTDFRTKVQEHKTAIKVASVSLVPAVMSTVTAVTAFASDGSSGSSSTSSIRDSMETSFSSIGNDILGFFSDILPIALPILGAGLVISIGIGIFKKVTKKASS